MAQVLEALEMAAGRASTSPWCITAAGTKEVLD